MAQIAYVGDLAAVIVPTWPTGEIAVTKGEPVEVPDELAANLLTSAAWEAADSSAVNAAKADPAPAAKADAQAPAPADPAPAENADATKAQPTAEEAH